MNRMREQRRMEEQHMYRVTAKIYALQIDGRYQESDRVEIVAARSGSEASRSTEEALASPTRHVHIMSVERCDARGRLEG